MTLREYFDKKILAELKPTTDQIGRCLDIQRDKEWNKGAGLEWLSSQLSILSNDKNEYNYNNMLTKIRALSAFGTILREMMRRSNSKLDHINTEVLSQLFNKSMSELEARNKELNQKTRHVDFDSPTTRSRIEKKPLILNNSEFKDVDIGVGEAGPKGLGFGWVYHPDYMTAKNDKGKVAIESYQQMENQSGGRQGMPRLGQDIKNLERPGLIGDSGEPLMPEAFKKLGLLNMLEQHHFLHGSGANRWQLQGTYSIESLDQDFPIAGAHSGGVSDILLAMNCLNQSSVYGKEEVKAAGLLLFAFMTFGGYHSFIETYKIVKSIAENENFSVEVKPKDKKLYEEALDIIQFYTIVETYQKIKKFYEAYCESMPSNSLSGVVDTSDVESELIDISADESELSDELSSQSTLADVPRVDESYFARANKPVTAKLLAKSLETILRGKTNEVENVDKLEKIEELKDTEQDSSATKVG